jgi:UDP-N-acetylglucosamine transferase subunit ALG13
VILVTIGTTLVFDELIEAVDDLCAVDFFDEEVVCQIGGGAYQPSHCEFFRFSPELETQWRQASAVFCHGGTGSVLQCILSQKQFIAFANPRADGDHQAEFLDGLSRFANILWTRDPTDIRELYPRMRAAGPIRLSMDSLADDLLAYLGTDVPQPA